MTHESKHRLNFRLTVSEPNGSKSLDSRPLERRGKREGSRDKEKESGGMRERKRGLGGERESGRLRERGRKRKKEWIRREGEGERVRRR